MQILMWRAAWCTVESICVSHIHLLYKLVIAAGRLVTFYKSYNEARQFLRALPFSKLKTLAWAYISLYLQNMILGLRPGGRIDIHGHYYLIQMNSCYACKIRFTRPLFLVCLEICIFTTTSNVFVSNVRLLKIFMMIVLLCTDLKLAVL